MSSEEKLFSALESGSTEQVTDLLKEPSINLNWKISTGVFSGWSILHMASANNDVEIVKLILSNPRIDPNIRNNYGYTPLQIAVARESYQVVQCLISDPRVVINVLNPYGETVLYRVSQSGNTQLVEILIKVPPGVYSSDEIQKCIRVSDRYFMIPEMLKSYLQV